MRLFGRECVVLIGRPPTAGEYALQTPTALRIEGLRIAFKVVRDLRPTPNTAEVSIWNLSPESRAKIDSAGQRVVLVAGYTGADGQIFSGDARRTSSSKQGPDWVTKIEAGDGERAYKFARVSESFGPGAKLADVVVKTVGQLKTDPGSTADKVKNFVGEFASGYTQHARASTELTRLLSPLGWTWSMQDGRVELLGPNETVQEEAPRLTPETGLVGSPTIDPPQKKGQKAVLKVRALLLPRLRPGQRLVIESEAHRGVFRAEKVTHTGDTWGNDWYTDIEAALL